MPVVVLPNKPATSNAKFATSTASIRGDCAGHVLSERRQHVRAADHAVATAYPVLTEVDGDAATYNLGAAVSSAPANSNGSWTIGNLRPGSYVVMLQPDRPQLEQPMGRHRVGV